jgi:hypothetical protein
MAYRSLSNGVVEADTLEELLAYQQVIQKAPVPSVVHLPVADVESVAVPLPDAPPVPKSPEEIWDEYCKKLKDNKYLKQRKVLALIKGAGSRRITVQELAKNLKVEGFAAGGTVSGIKKTAGSFGIQAEQIVIRDEDGHYRAGELLEQFQPPEP